jgi:tyrosyl-tRNA synthetase
MNGKQVYGLTSPLVMTASGQKMGKTASGAVWLSPEKLSAYDYWQFWRNTDDQDVGKYLRLFTELPMAEIKRLEALRDTEINEAKKILADQATTLARGSDCLEEIHKTVAQLFDHQAGTLESLPSIMVNDKDLSAGIPLADLLQQTGLAPSKGEARRLIKNGGARLNDQPVNDEWMTLNPTHLSKDNMIKLSAGKKRHAVVKVAG